MISTVIFILILSLLIIVHEFGHFIAARKNGVRVEQFSLGFGPQVFKKKKGDTEYSLSLIPLGGYVKMAGDNQAEYKGKPDEYLSKLPGRRFQIIFFGPFLNYVLGFLFFWCIFFIGYPTLTTKVGGLIDGYGAKDAGLKVADKIIAVDGRKVDVWEDLQRQIQERKSKGQVILTILRDNQELSLNVLIKDKLTDDQLGQKRPLGIIGISPFDELVEVKHGFLESADLAFKKIINLTVITYQGLWRLASGRMSMRDSMTGPLGIFFITSKAAKLGLIAVMHLIAILSVSLAIFNLLPLPILDGGHLFLLGLEKIRRKALGVKAEEVINNIGFTLIITLALFVTYNDIVRLYGDKVSKLVSK
jgi:regulator of sigma E protease